MKNKNAKLLSLLILPLMLLITSFTNKDSNENNSYQYIENTSTYEAIDGTRTVTWAQGVKAPKLSMDKDIQNSDGYFKLVTSGQYQYFEVEFEPNKGYFDYNKNINKRHNEKPLCYLASSSNLISWWLEQNSDYVDQYLLNLKNGVYQQDSNLYDILPFDENFWINIRKGPGEPNNYEINDNLKAQTLGNSYLSVNALKPYYNKKDIGYYQDMVLDFFFNGYDAIPSPSYAEANTQNNFKPDKRGGFFYPLFGKEILSHRYEGVETQSFDFYEKNLGNFLKNGYGVSIGYNTGEYNSTKHAITVWGAEYDSFGHLKKIYVTDSDDLYNNNLVNFGDTYARGLFSYDTVKGSNGSLYLTTNPNAKLVNKVVGLTTLDLAKDKLEAKLNDVTQPTQPSVSLLRYNENLPLNSEYEISYKATVSDSGTLEYNWYESDVKGSRGNIIENQHSPTLKIKSSTEKIKYYTFEAINFKNGYRSNFIADQIKVCFDSNSSIVHAQTPIVEFDPYKEESFYQYDKNARITCHARVDDGGTLSYQWYTTNRTNSISDGILLPGETKDYLEINTDTLGKKGYYCVVTNTNYSPNITGYNVISYTPRLSKNVIIKEAPIIKDASNPIINNILNDNEYNLNDSVNPLVVNASSIDNGDLSYQWYEFDSKDINSNKTILLGQTSDSFNPLSNNVGTRYYGCLVTNTNNRATNNKSASIFTNVVSIKIKEKIILSNDSSLKDLSVNGFNLTPNFDKNIFKYKLDVDNSVTNIDINAITNDSKAIVEIINKQLEVGVNNIKIIVTAQDLTTSTYEIEVNRKAPVIHVHEYGEWEIIKEATCHETGIKRRYCKCGHYEEEIIEKIKHEYESIITPPTCTEKGFTTHTCIHCQDSYIDSYVDALGHEYGEWEIIKEATCNETGIKRRYCKCGHYEEEIIPMIIEQKPINPEIKPNKTNKVPLIIGITTSISFIIFLLIFLIIKMKHK